MILQKVIPRPVRVKADNTGTFSTSSLLEIPREVFEIVNGWAFDKEEIVQLLFKLDSPEYKSYILAEAKRLAEEL